MDFSAKRMTLLAGIGDPEDRHDIVQEQVQQLNESIEARQLNEAEEEVRKAVRRTIQKMIAEGGDDFVSTGLTGGSVHVMEEEGDEEDIDQLEEAEEVAPPAAKSPPQRRLPDRGSIKIDAKLLRDKLTPGQLKMLGLEETNHLDEDTFHDEERHDDMDVDHLRRIRDEINNHLRRLEMQHGRAEHRHEERDEGELREDELEEHEVYGVESFPGPGAIAAMDAMLNPHTGQVVAEDEDGVIYELEGGGLEMQLGDKRYVLQELEGDEELNELEEDEREIPDGATHAEADTDVTFSTKTEVE
jgi:hypothetical protein